MNYMPYGAPYPTYMPPRTEIQSAPQMQPTTQAGFRCVPVASREEAVAMLTDYFSPGIVMPDFGHGMVYFKRFNQNTGASDFYDFALVQREEESKTDAFGALGAQLAAMSERLDGFAVKFDEFRQEMTRSVKKSDRQYAADDDTDDAVGA